jgi:hypothetical protein
MPINDVNEARDVTVAPPDSGGATSHVDFSKPRLSVMHFVLWAASFAICFLAHLFLFSRFEFWPEFHRIAIIGIYGLTMGTVCAALLAVPGWRAQGYRFPTYGGEWLVIIEGIVTVMTVVGRFTIIRAEQSGGDLWLLPVIMDGTLLAVGSLSCWLWVKWKTAQREWTWFFCGMAMHITISAFVLFVAPSAVADVLFPWLRYATQFAVFLLLSIAAAADLRARQELPWTHWLGIAVYVVNMAGLILDYLWFTYPGSART